MDNERNILPEEYTYEGINKGDIKMNYCPKCRSFFEYYTNDLCSYLNCTNCKPIKKETFTKEKQEYLMKWIGETFNKGSK